MNFKNIMQFLPEVRGPMQKKLDFGTKLKWTLIILISFFVLANIPIYGLASAALERFEYLAIILGTEFGSVISLGIGPIVMASIILQLLVGSKILEIDTSTPDGKKYFQGLQKMLVFFFILFEAIVYVVMRGLEAAPGHTFIVIFQLILGGLAIVFMNEVSEKWGFGSGVSLFIAAGVSWRMFTGLFQFINPQGQNCLLNFGQVPCAGKVLVVIQAVINQAPIEALTALAVIIVTAIVFFIIVWAQSLKIEVPLSYNRMRGYSIKWPLAFFYASVIPVILTAALSANIQLFAGLLENWLGHATFLGGFSQGQPVSGLAYWVSPVNVMEVLIARALTTTHILRAITHTLFYVFFTTIFAVFWVKTSGMDASSQAENIMSSGLQIPGFRKDKRVLESVLSRYVMPLTVMGGFAIGLLAALADLTGALVGGTAILLVVMILYKFYENIAQQHAVDMHPALKKFMGQ